MLNQDDAVQLQTMVAPDLHFSRKTLGLSLGSLRVVTTHIDICLSEIRNTHIAKMAYTHYSSLKCVYSQLYYIGIYPSFSRTGRSYRCFTLDLAETWAKGRKMAGRWCVVAEAALPSR